MRLSNASKPPAVLILLGPDTDPELVLSCAAAVSKGLHAARRCICYGKAPEPALPAGIPCSTIPAMDALPREIAAAGASGDIKMIVSDWPRRSAQLYHLLEMHKQNNVPTMLVRKAPHRSTPRKALVLASGGPHIVHHFWAAQEICAERNLAPRILCVENPWNGEVQENEDKTECKTCPTGAGAARLVGMKAPLELCRCEDIIRGITMRVQRDDMLILGGPNYARLGPYFTGSIPDVVSKKVPNDSVMILGRKPAALNLRDVFWEELICMDMAPTHRNDIITKLTDNLIKNKQIPIKWRRYVLDKAFRREAILPTTTDAGTAFPHVTVPGISGIIGALGICPEGVDFGGGPSEPIRFIFLLITPIEQYDDYLGMLSDIATIMISPERRREILQSNSPKEILDKLERYQHQSRQGRELRRFT